MNASRYGFSQLFERAMGCWPATLNLVQVFTSTTRPDLYEVRDLGQLRDAFAEAADEQPDAILMALLHDAIWATLHSAARFCTRIERSAVRRDTVKENFEHRLRRALANPDLGWTPDEAILVTKYLDANR